MDIHFKGLRKYGFGNHRQINQGLMWFAVWFITSPLWAQEFRPGEIYPEVACQQDPDFSYSLYLPQNYGSMEQHPLVLIFEPASRATVPLEPMRAAADRFGYVLACSNNTGNMVSFANNIKAAKAFWRDVATRFKIDQRRTYTAGFSGGARLASEIAIVTGNIAGLIACGAGFRETSHARKTIPFPIALAIGYEDMNYMEIMDLYQKLGFAQTHRRLFRFDDGHVWSPSEVFMNVFSWLELQAMKSKLIPLNQIFINSFWEHDLALAEQWLQEGRTVDVQRHYQRMTMDYEGLKDVSFAKNHSKRMRQSVAYKDALQRQTRLENAEKLNQRKYIQKLRGQEDNLPKDLSEINGEVRYWINEKQRQDRHIANTGKDDERLMAIRLNDFVWRMSSERANRLFAGGDYKEALFLYLVVGNYVPEYSFHLVMVAKCYARLGASEQAVAYLEHALKKGVPNAEALVSDPSFDLIRTHPDFEALFQDN